MACCTVYFLLSSTALGQSIHVSSQRNPFHKVHTQTNPLINKLHAPSHGTRDPIFGLSSFHLQLSFTQQANGSSSNCITNSTIINSLKGRSTKKLLNHEFSTLCGEGKLKEAFDILRIIYEGGNSSSSFAYGCLLQGCAKMKALPEGKQVHLRIIKTGFGIDMFLGTSLVNMYIRCESLAHARQVFDKMPSRNSVLWNSMIAGYSHYGRGEEAIMLFCQMQKARIKSDQFTFASVVKASAGFEALEQGKQVYAHIIKAGCKENDFVGNALVDMYAKCGCIDDARQVFDKIPQRNSISWNAMIARYAQHGHGENTLVLFGQMQRADVKPNEFTFGSVLSACSHLETIEEGRQVHAYVAKSGLESHVVVGSALIDMYTKCGIVDDGRKVFDEMCERNVVSWNSMIGGYSRHGYGEEALILFCQMHREGLRPDKFTFPAIILGVSTNPMAGGQGRGLHAHIIKIGFEPDVFVASTLITMYATCGRLEDSCNVFHSMHKPDMVLWSAMVAAYVQNGHGEEALNIFCKMLHRGTGPDQFIYSSVIGGCGSLAALEEGKQVHGHSIKTGFELDGPINNALVTMYARCGSIEHARVVFRKMAEPNIISWNAMIAGCAQHGHGNDALQLFQKMQQTGIQPNHITFIGVLSACSHVGLVNEGLHNFFSMYKDHGITPTPEHYACVVDLFGRAGRLNEAEDFINKMPFEPSAAVWGTLLAACRIHGNMDLGRHAAECLLELEPENPSSYVLLSNIYAASGRWDDVASVRRMMRERGMKKDPGCSWIEVKNKVHTFVAGDRSHPQTEAIHAKLEEVIMQIKGEGYVPDTSFVLHDMGYKQKELSLSYHSEKLAIAFGLVSMPPSTPIRVIKNLRVCDDCHTASKFISIIAGREIVLRDANRFHHFKDGLCSCEDYW